MRVVFFWEAAGLSIDRANPYGALMARAMARLGVEFEPGYRETLCRLWLEQNRGRVDVLHLNWPSFLYSEPVLAEHVASCAAFVENLARARSLGYMLVWTVHNLYPHESPNPEVDRLARFAVAHFSHVVIVHCQHARELVKQHFFRTADVLVIPHGHFIDPYPNTISRDEARTCLNLPKTSFVYLNFGNLRPNKGVENLLEAFESIPGEDTFLLLALKSYNQYGAELVKHASKRNARIRVHDSAFFDNSELQVYFNAADVVVLPFRDILTSGSAITALSFYRPVIAPAIGCIPELIDNGVGILYNPNQPEALREAMVAIRRCAPETYHHAIRRKLETLNWDSIAQLTLAAYRG